MMDFSVQKWNILLCLTETPGFSVHYFWNDCICLTRSIRSRVQLKFLSLNSKLSMREHWLIVLKNFLFSYRCDSWINRLLSLDSKLSVRENWLILYSLTFYFLAGVIHELLVCFSSRCELGPPLLTSLKDTLLYKYVFSAALAKSGPLDFPLEKIFLIFFAHEMGLGHTFQK